MDNLFGIVLLVICGANLALNVIGYVNSRKSEEELNKALDDLTKDMDSK